MSENDPSAGQPRSHGRYAEKVQSAPETVLTPRPIPRTRSRTIAGAWEIRTGPSFASADELEIRAQPSIGNRIDTTARRKKGAWKIVGGYSWSRLPDHVHEATERALARLG